MKHLALLLPLLLIGCAQQREFALNPQPGNIPLITEIYPSPDGSRQLDLRGLFHGADTVLVQVYHDSDVLVEESRIYTWALPLGEYHQYVIKFTDERKRVKYLAIFELCDGVIEYVPEITIDFERTGNLLLYKPSDGRPDFLLLETGLSRKPQFETVR